MPTASAEPADPVLLAEALRPALLRVSRRLRQESQKVGVSSTEALVLGQIKRNPGVGVCDLADAEQISRPTMSSHVKRLEAAGWVARADHAQDGRRSGLEVTPAGDARLDQIRRLRNDWLSARLARLPATERDSLAAAAGLLIKLLEVAP